MNVGEMLLNELSQQLQTNCQIRFEEEMERESNKKLEGSLSICESGRRLEKNSSLESTMFGILGYLGRCLRVLSIWKKIWSWWHLDNPISFRSFSIKDIALGNIVSRDCCRVNKVIHGVFQCALWAIWKWRNKIINAPLDSVDGVKNEDIFLFIQRISRTSISARCQSKPVNWDC
ncbi:hypothetical protein Tco_0517775 [Tanacetum coccineum]